MNTNCFPNSKCRVCRNLTISTAIAITGTDMVITIPAATYTNRENVCILLAQNIPASATPLPVVIQIDGATGTIPLRDKCGNNIYSDQLNSRMIYPFYAATDSQTFVYRLRSGCLPKTRHSFLATIPTATVPAVTN